MSEGRGSLFADHSIAVLVSLHTTREDVQAALARSGLVEGALIGEALIVEIEELPKVTPDAPDLYSYTGSENV